MDKSADKLLSTFSPIEVRIPNGNFNFEKSVKKFTKKVKKYGVLEELRERSYHKTKGQKRRAAHEKAVRLQKKENLSVNR